MSRACIIFEFNPGEWYCEVAQGEYDYDMNHFTVYGPKSTEDAAWKLMSSYECNPGGCRTYHYCDITATVRAEFAEIIKKARRR
jgi:hypothetical protein